LLEQRSGGAVSFERIRADVEAAAGRPLSARVLARCYLFDMGFRAVLYYRLANWLVTRKVKYLPNLIAARCLRVFGADILPQAAIGPGLVIKHPVGLVIGFGTRIGRNCVLMQNVTLGEKYSAGTEGRYPVLGDDVTVCAGAVVLGGLRIGSGAVVGANSVVTRDVAEGVVVAGAPARVIGASSPPRVA